MVSSLNKVTLIGNLGRDPEIRNTHDGKEIASFSLATSDAWKDKNTGEKKEKIEWHKVVVFQPHLVGIIKNYIHKGSKLYIEGTLQTRKWTDNSGTEKYVTEVVLQPYSGTIIILDSKQSGNNIDDTKRNIYNPDKSKVYQVEEIEDDEIPF